MYHFTLLANGFLFKVTISCCFMFVSAKMFCYTGICCESFLSETMKAIRASQMETWKVKNKKNIILDFYCLFYLLYDVAK